MSLKNLTAGTYPATLVDWSMEMVEALNQPQIVLRFDFDHDGEIDSLNFKSLLFTKDGGVSQKTLKTLEVIEFKSNDITALNTDPNCVNNQKPYTVTIEKDEKTGKYWNIEWVNDPASRPAEVPKEQKAEGVKGFNFSSFNKVLQTSKGKAEPKADAKTKPPVKNYADGIGKGTAANDDELPF